MTPDRLSPDTHFTTQSIGGTLLQQQPHTVPGASDTHLEATSVRGLKVLVYEALSLGLVSKALRYQCMRPYYIVNTVPDAWRPVIPTYNKTTPRLRAGLLLFFFVFSFLSSLSPHIALFLFLFRHQLLSVQWFPCISKGLVSGMVCFSLVKQRLSQCLTVGAPHGTRPSGALAV
jgi:hypothetical protein